MFLVIAFHALYKFPLRRNPIWTFVVLSLTHIQLSATLWTAACQASLSFTTSRSLLTHMSIESVMPSNLCRPLLLLPSIFPSIRVFSNESALCIRWPKYGGFCFSVCPPNEYSRLITFRIFCKDPASTLPHQEFACPSSEFLWHLGTPPGKHTIQCHVHLFFYLWEFLEDRDS